jgi:hypothetical protein
VKGRIVDKFNFLLGDWKLEYNVPVSMMSKKATGHGKGTFKKALDDHYVFFDYISHIDGQTGKAHGVFAIDEKADLYRYWWFESSGAFQTASCNFINDDTLFMNWHDTLLVQTFTRIDKNQVILKMENPDASGNYQLVLEVKLIRT